MNSEIPPNKAITPDVTANELESFLHKHKLSPDLTKNKEYIKCDYCSSEIYSTEEYNLTQYLADDILNDNHPKSNTIHEKRPLVQLATYCPDCSDARLFFPCKGFSETRVNFSISDDWIIMNPRVTDISKIDDGIPWDPRKVSEEITGVKFNRVVSETNELWGPENIFTVYDATIKSVNLDELIYYDGSLNKDILQKVKNEYTEFCEEMSQGGYSENKFTKYVKDK